MEYMERLKRIGKFISPTGFIDVYKRLTANRPSKPDFITWWEQLSSTNSLPPDLVEMVNAFIRSSDFSALSKYWLWLNIQHIQHLLRLGYPNFKQTVARHYFTCVGELGSIYNQDLLKNAQSFNVEVSLKEIFKKHDQFSLVESINFNLVTALLFDHVQNIIKAKQMEMPEEPLEGNPPYITINNKRVTQDVLNSVLEYRSISDGCELNKVSSILEVGAGSGRTSFCLMTYLPNIKYVVADIPPALFISQTYLTDVFPRKRIFKFRPFESFSAIKNEYDDADIVFIMPHQLDLLPRKSFELFLAIDCLHEMKRKQVEFYFDHANRLSRLLYYKCWRKTTVRFDDITYTENDYPVQSHWRQLFKRRCDVLSSYFEACYLMDSAQPVSNVPICSC